MNSDRKTKEAIEAISQRFDKDAAGFCKVFTKVFVENDGKPQKLYPKQVEFMNLLKPEENIVTVVKCRQSGFSTGIQGKAVHRAYFGKVPEILITSVGQNQSMRVLRKIKEYFKSMPEFMQTGFKKETETQIQLMNGVNIYSLPANPDACRGFTGDVFMDEYGVQNRKDSEELWEAIMPCIVKGYNLVTVSTPKGKNNMFYDLINPRKDPETGKLKGPQAKRVISVPWWEVPHIAEKIEDIRNSMHPRQFLQEFECVFLDDDETTLFTHDFMMDHVVDQRENGLAHFSIDFLNEYNDDIPSDMFDNEFKDMYAKGIYIGWDVAITGDGSIITVFGVTKDDTWELITFKKFERNTDITVQVNFVNKLYQYFKPRRLTFDATAGLGLAVHTLLKERGIPNNILNPFKFTTATKGQEYSEMRSKMEKGGFKIYDIDECVKEFTTLGYNPITGRIAAIGSHRKNHDDWPSSMLCAYAGRYKGGNDQGFHLIRVRSY